MGLSEGSESSIGGLSSEARRSVYEADPGLILGARRAYPERFVGL